MVRVACPVCGERVTTEEIPSRLPLVVPDHTAGTGNRCSGSGRTSSQAWMVKPEMEHG